MVKIEVTIIDQFWPNLRMVMVRHNLDGTKTTLTRDAQYDLAYTQFEGDLHNALRPVVEQITRRHFQR